MRLLKPILSLAAFAVILYLFWPLLGELKDTADLFREVSWCWLVAAVTVQMLSYLCLAGLNYYLILPFAKAVRFWRLMAVLPAMAFIEAAVPSAGASGLILRARLLRPDGIPPEISTFTVILETVYLVSIMVTLALGGVWYLGYAGGIGEFNWIMLALLTFISIGAGTVIYFGVKDRQRVHHWIDQLTMHWSRFRVHIKQPPVSPSVRAQFSARVDDFYEGLAQLKHVPIWRFWATSFGRVSLDVATLGVCFAAFQYSISLSALLAGYGLVLLLSALAALPGGLGMADASLAIIFTRLGVPGAVAVAAALAYRIISFWLLRFIGFFTWQTLETRT